MAREKKPYVRTTLEIINVITDNGAVMSCCSVYTTNIIHTHTHDTYAEAVFSQYTADCCKNINYHNYYYTIL